MRRLPVEHRVAVAAGDGIRARQHHLRGIGALVKPPPLAPLPRPVGGGVLEFRVEEADQERHVHGRRGRVQPDIDLRRNLAKVDAVLVNRLLEGPQRIWTEHPRLALTGQLELGQLRRRRVDVVIVRVQVFEHGLNRRPEPVRTNAQRGRVRFAQRLQARRGVFLILPDRLRLRRGACGRPDRGARSPHVFSTERRFCNCELRKHRLKVVAHANLSVLGVLFRRLQHVRAADSRLVLRGALGGWLVGQHALRGRRPDEPRPECTEQPDTALPVDHLDLPAALVVQDLEGGAEPEQLARVAARDSADVEGPVRRPPARQPLPGQLAGAREPKQLDSRQLLVRVAPRLGGRRFGVAFAPPRSGCSPRAEREPAALAAEAPAAVLPAVLLAALFADRGLLARRRRCRCRRWKRDAALLLVTLGVLAAPLRQHPLVDPCELAGLGPVGHVAVGDGHHLRHPRPLPPGLLHRGAVLAVLAVLRAHGLRLLLTCNGGAGLELSARFLGRGGRAGGGGVAGTVVVAAELRAEPAVAEAAVVVPAAVLAHVPRRLPEPR